MSSLTYIPSFSVKFFVQPIYIDYSNQTQFDKTAHFKYSPLKPLNQIKPNLAGWSLCDPPLRLCPTARSPFKMVDVIKIEVSLIVYCYFIYAKMGSYMTISLAYIFCDFFSLYQGFVYLLYKSLFIPTLHIWKNITFKILCSTLELKLSLIQFKRAAITSCNQQKFQMAKYKRIR